MNAHRNLLLFLLLAAGFLLGTAGVAMAEAVPAGCEVPLIVQQGNVAPNVLIIMDDSGSMNEAMFHPDYNPAVRYPGNFTWDTMYYVSTTGLYKPRSFKAAWPTTPTAPLVAGVNGQQGRYLGNYLNWVFFTATTAQRAALPQVTRFHVGRTAVQTILSSTSGLRYGLMGFNNDNGGKLYSACGTPVATIITKLIAMAPNSWTPSAETMISAMSYFQSTGAGAWIQYPCQDNFIIFVTDGFPTKDLNIPAWIGDPDGDGQEPGTCASIGATDYPASNDCSSWLDDVTYYMAHNDMRPDMEGVQHVYTYTVGMNLDAPLVAMAAVKGGGFSQSAWDLNSLTQTLGTVISDIVQRISSGAAVAVVSTEQGNGDRLYRGKFMPGLWRGFLEAYALPYSAGDTPVWEAGQLLSNRNPNDRNLITLLPNGNESPFVSDVAASLQATLGAASVDQAANLISWVRGSDVAGKRNRHHWLLGDLVYSTPLVVGPPSNYFVTASYQQFLHNNLERQHVIYVGANDGVLHAFNADNGTEMWGYVPQGVMGSFSALADTNYCHKSFVDLSPTAYDVQINGAWRTVLMGGLRTGGNSYFAIDVTNPAAPHALWETAVPGINSSFTEPAVVRKGNATYAWTGSGPDWLGTAHIAILNMATGVSLGTPLISNAVGVNLCNGATPYDSDWDGITDYVYQADLKGSLYRFDVRDPNPANWYGTLVYGGTQPIQTRPEVALGQNGEAMVYFGTGKYIESSDLSTVTTQRFVCVKDTGNLAGITAANLADQSSAIHDMAGYKGWFFNLTAGVGERVTEPAAVVEGVVYFTSFAPRSGACTGGGHSWLYHVDFRDGAAVRRHPTDQGSTNDRVDDIGDGVASKPVVNLGDSNVIIQTSDARLNLTDLRMPPQWMSVRAWRETFPSGTSADSTQRRTAGN